MGAAETGCPETGVNGAFATSPKTFVSFRNFRQKLVVHADECEPVSACGIFNNSEKYSESRYFCALPVRLSAEKLL